jgi:putative RecB family exonuclease
MADKVLRVDVSQRPNATLPRRVSYSQMSLYEQCGLKFYFSYLGGWKEPQTVHLAIGSLTHDVIERLYKLPAEERTLENAIELLRKHGPEFLQLPDYQPFAEDMSLRQSVREAVENLFVVENPRELEVRPENLELELSVEMNGVNFFGKVDRYTDAGINRVSDYKTGKSPGKYVDDKLAQPYMYALAFKLQHDIDVQEVELIYLNAREVVRREVDLDIMMAQGEKLAKMRAGSEMDIKDSAWDAKPQRLCDWCKFQEACPARNPDAPQPGTIASDDVLKKIGLFQR